MTPFTLLVEKLSNSPDKGVVILLTLDGELDETNIEEYAPKIYKLIEESSARQTLIFNLLHLKYMNSKAIGYLTDWSGKIRSKEGQLIIVEVPAIIKDLITSIGIDSLFREYDTLEDAKKDIYGK